MAVKTSNGTGGGNWGTGATWSGGVAPVDGDSFVIAGGDTVTFNVDQSGFATGMVAGTITGTLALTTTPGTYVLKMDGVSGHNIVGTGNWLFGSSGSPVAANVIFTLDLGTASALASPPTDPIFFHRITYEANTHYVFVDIPIYGQRNVPLTITGWFANSASGSFAQLPKMELRDPDYNVSDSAGALTSATMADNTNWQTLTLNYTPTTDRQLVLRVYGARASGNTYFNYQITQYTVYTNIGAPKAF